MSDVVCHIYILLASPVCDGHRAKVLDPVLYVAAVAGASSAADATFVYLSAWSLRGKIALLRQSDMFVRLHGAGDAYHRSESQV